MAIEGLLALFVIFFLQWIFKKFIFN